MYPWIFPLFQSVGETRKTTSRSPLVIFLRNFKVFEKNQGAFLHFPKIFSSAGELLTQKTYVFIFLEAKKIKKPSPWHMVGRARHDLVRWTTTEGEKKGKKSTKTK